MKNETIKTFDFNIDVSVYQNEFNNLDWNYLNKLQEKMILKSSGLFKDMAHLPVGFDKAIVLKFLNKQINFQKLISLIYKILNQREFLKFKKIKPKNIDDIYQLRLYVSSKMDSLGI